jgi:hypothetical protein
VTPSIVRQLVLKDLYLSRWIVAGSTLAGLIALGIAPLGSMAFYVSSVSFICVMIVLVIYLVMAVVPQERKDKALLFILSLPVSTTQYTLAKMAASFVAFFGSWLVLSAACLAMIAASAIPDGMSPVIAAILLYFLCYFCVLLGVGIAAESASTIPVVIVIGNVLINFFIPLVFRLPSGAHASGDTAVWGADIVAVLVLEIALCAAALVTGFVVQTRKKDFA